MGKVAFIRAVKAYGGSIGVTPLILKLVHLMEMSTQHHVLATLFLWKDSPPRPVRIGQEDAWATKSVWTIYRKEKSAKVSKLLTFSRLMTYIYIYIYIYVVPNR